MNNLMLLVVLFVMFIYFGGSNVPLVLKQNKEMLLGVAGGLVLCSFFGMKLEGFDFDLELSNPDHALKYQAACCEKKEENGRLSGAVRGDFENCGTLGGSGLGAVRNALCSQLVTDAYSEKTCDHGVYRPGKDRALINKAPNHNCTSDFECCGELTCEDGKCGGTLDSTICPCDKLTNCERLQPQLEQFPLMTDLYKNMCDSCFDESSGAEDMQLKTKDSLGCQ